MKSMPLLTQSPRSTKRERLLSERKLHDPKDRDQVKDHLLGDVIKNDPSFPTTDEACLLPALNPNCTSKIKVNPRWSTSSQAWTPSAASRVSTANSFLMSTKPTLDDPRITQPALSAGTSMGMSLGYSRPSTIEGSQTTSLGPSRATTADVMGMDAPFHKVMPSPPSKLSRADFIMTPDTPTPRHKTIPTPFNTKSLKADAVSGFGFDTPTKPKQAPAVPPDRKIPSTPKQSTRTPTPPLSTPHHIGTTTPPPTTPPCAPQRHMVTNIYTAKTTQSVTEARTPRPKSGSRAVPSYLRTPSPKLPETPSRSPPKASNRCRGTQTPTPEDIQTMTPFPAPHPAILKADRIPYHVPRPPPSDHFDVGWGRVGSPVDGSCIDKLDSWLGAEYYSVITSPIQPLGYFKQQAVDKRLAQEERDRFAAQEGHKLAQQARQAADVKSPKHAQWAYVNEQVAKVTADTIASAKKFVDDVCESAAAAKLKEEEEVLFNSQNKGITIMGGTLEEGVYKLQPRHIQGHQSHDEAQAVYRELVEFKSKPLTEEREQWLKEEHAKQRKAMMSEQERLKDLEARYIEEEENRVLKEELAKQLQRRTMEQRKEFLSLQDKYTERITGIIDHISENRDVATPDPETFLQIRCLQKAEVMMSRMELQAAEAEQEVVERKRRVAKRRDEEKKQQRLAREEAVAKWWQEQEEQLDRYKGLMQDLHEEFQHTIQHYQKKGVTLEELDAPVDVKRTPIPANLDPIHDTVDEAKRWMMCWHEETHRHHMAALSIQLAVRQHWARERVKTYRRARVIVQSRLLQEEWAVEAEYYQTLQEAEEALNRELELEAERERARRRAATLAQAFWRMMKKRLEFLRLRKAKKEEMRDRERLFAAVRVQAYIRGSMVRYNKWVERNPELAAKRAKRRENRAAMRIQKQVRGWNTRKTIRQQTEAVRCIQRMVRRFIALKDVHFSSEWWATHHSIETQDYAVRLLQRVLKHHLLFRIPVQRLLAKHRAAAIKIQAWYRGILGRREAERIMKQKQGLWTDEMQERYENYLQARIEPYEVTPNDIHAWHVRFRRGLMEQESATLIQAVWRGYQGRKRLELEKLLRTETIRKRRHWDSMRFWDAEDELRNYAAKTIQRFWRGIVASIRTRKTTASKASDQWQEVIAEDAAIIMQSTWRGYRGRELAKATKAQVSPSNQDSLSFREAYAANLATIDLRRNVAAIKIQSAWRVYWANKLREARARQAMDEAEARDLEFHDKQARKIQIFFQLAVQRSRKLPLRPEKRAEAAARRIQGFFKFVMAKNICRSLSKEEDLDLEAKEKDDAAFIIQNGWRRCQLEKCAPKKA